ncbi:MAG: YihY/virulence factor BrkB family protein [Methanothrix sp.]|jgi:membrane protein|uniref:YihY/virulence factor BrkB family protein n=2 Tax=Methanothrix sp. TaxID=90426 RepID=UPI003BB7FA8F
MSMRDSASDLRKRMVEDLLRRFDHADRRSRGTLRLLTATFKSMSETESWDAAAAIAYYSLFSLFPMLILLVILGTLFLESEENYHQLMNFISGILPPAESLAKENIQVIQDLGDKLNMHLPLRDLLQENFNQILHLRLPVGIAATAGLFWSATGVFVILSRNIDRAWSNSKGRNPLEWRLVGIAMVGSLLIGLIILSMVVVSLLGLLDYGLGLLLGEGIAYHMPLESKLLYRLFPDAVIFIAFTILYWWAPKVDVRWSDAAFGAFVAALCWELSKMGFAWYLESGLSNHMLVYGSLGTVVILMLWIYLSGLICLFGAHLVAQMVGRRQAAAAFRESHINKDLKADGA